jgi:hypothetical protein
MVYGFDGDVIDFIEDGDHLRVDSETGTVTITRGKAPGRN